MKNSLLMLLAILLPGYMSTVSFAASDRQSEICLAAVNSYVGALKRGDLENLKMLLGSPLLSKKKKLLENQSYSKLLFDKYNASTHTATIVSGTPNNTIFVDVVLTFKNQESMKVRFQAETSTSPVTQEITCKIVNEVS